MRPAFLLLLLLVAGIFTPPALAANFNEVEQEFEELDVGGGPKTPTDVEDDFKFSTSSPPLASEAASSSKNCSYPCRLNNGCVCAKNCSSIPMVDGFTGVTQRYGICAKCSLGYNGPTCARVDPVCNHGDFHPNPKNASLFTCGCPATWTGKTCSEPQCLRKSSEVSTAAAAPIPVNTKTGLCPQCSSSNYNGMFCSLCTTNKVCKGLKPASSKGGSGSGSGSSDDREMVCDHSMVVPSVATNKYIECPDMESKDKFWGESSVLKVSSSIKSQFSDDSIATSYAGAFNITKPSSFDNNAIDGTYSITFFRQAWRHSDPTGTLIRKPLFTCKATGCNGVFPQKMEKGNNGDLKISNIQQTPEFNRAQKGTSWVMFVNLALLIVNGWVPSKYRTQGMLVLFATLAAQLVFHIAFFALWAHPDISAAIDKTAQSVYQCTYSGCKCLDAPPSSPPSPSGSSSWRYEDIFALPTCSGTDIERTLLLIDSGVSLVCYDGDNCNFNITGIPSQKHYGLFGTGFSGQCHAGQCLDVLEPPKVNIAEVATISGIVFLCIGVLVVAHFIYDRFHVFSMNRTFTKVFGTGGGAAAGGNLHENSSLVAVDSLSIPRSRSEFAPPAAPPAQQPFGNGSRLSPPNNNNNNNSSMEDEKEVPLNSSTARKISSYGSTSNTLEGNSGGGAGGAVATVVPSNFSITSKQSSSVFYNSADEDAVLQLDQVTYRVDKKKILNGVSCHVKSGSTIALMGPSGAGKTTLLDLMAMRTKEGTIGGSVRLNGESVSRSAGNVGKYKRLIGYVAQHDTLIPALTVRQTITYAARLKLPAPISAEAINELVDDTIDRLYLRRCEHTRIGDSNRRGVSGGEKRRVSIATELVGNPRILVLDEPTSGLDSVSAFEVVRAITGAARKPHMRRYRSFFRYRPIVIFSIHQPSESIYRMFDQVCVLQDGHMMYFGPALSAVSSLRFNAGGITGRRGLSPGSAGETVLANISLTSSEGYSPPSRSGVSPATEGENRSFPKQPQKLEQKPTSKPSSPSSPAPHGDDNDNEPNREENNNDSVSSADVSPHRGGGKRGGHGLAISSRESIHDEDVAASPREFSNQAEALLMLCHKISEHSREVGAVKAGDDEQTEHHPQQLSHRTTPADSAPTIIEQVSHSAVTTAEDSFEATMAALKSQGYQTAALLASSSANPSVGDPTTTEAPFAGGEVRLLKSISAMEHDIVKYRPTGWQQFKILSQRSIASLIGSYYLIAAHCFFALFLGIACSFLYQSDTLDLAGTENKAGMVTFILLLVGFSSLSSLELFLAERKLFEVDYENGYYGVLPYFTVKVLFDFVPLRILPTAVLASVVYYPVGLRFDSGTYYLWFVEIVTCYSVVVTSLTLIFGIIAPAFGPASLFASLAVLWNTAFGGLLVQTPSIKPGLQFFKILSPVFYSYESLMINELQGQNVEFQPKNNEGLNSNDLTIKLTGDQFLYYIGLNPNQFGRDVAVLHLEAVVLTTLAFLALVLRVNMPRIKAVIRRAK